MKKKGFIGPLGDDIPSIFPIVTGILIFILSLVYLQQQLAVRNGYLNLKQATLDLSYLATEKGYMPQTEFEDKCGVLKETAKKNGIRFAMVLKKYCGKIDVNEALTLADHDTGASLYWFGKDLLCATAEDFEPESTPVAANPPAAVVLPSENAFILSYPMAVDCAQGLRGLGLLSIAGWV
ncbi:MAG: hypothetical protein V1787_05875 [Candidatus Micrarchaeota archaeon]